MTSGRVDGEIKDSGKHIEARNCDIWFNEGSFVCTSGRYVNVV